MSESNGELSLMDLVVKVRDWWYYLLSKWLIILVFCIIGGGVGVLYAINKKPTYTGILTFVLSNDSKSGVGGLASLAGQFGLDVGGGGNGAFEGENIIELLKSKRIVKRALFKRIPDENEILVNVIGKEFKLFNKWKKKDRLSGLIPFPEDINKLTSIQDSLITEIHIILLKENLNVIKQDKKLSFYQVDTRSSRDDISIWLTKFLVDEAAKMYIETKTKTARENLQMLQHEADSLRYRLGGTIYASASTIDATFNLNPALQTQRAPIQQNQVQAQVLGLAYGEVIKNLEIAKITLQKETPLFQIIDEPSSPLKVSKSSKILCGIIGIFISGVLCVIVLLIRRMYVSFYKRIPTEI